MAVELRVNIAPNPALDLEDIIIDVERYWGQLRPIDFLVSCELIKRIRDRAPMSKPNPNPDNIDETKYIALKIVNYNNPLRIGFDWIRFDMGNQPKASTTTLYCVLNSATVDYLTRPMGDEFNSINARMAKDGAGNVYVYFHRSRAANRGDGSGGDGNIAGVKLPSN